MQQLPCRILGGAEQVVGVESSAAQRANRQRNPGIRVVAVQHAAVVEEYRVPRLQPIIASFGQDHAIRAESEVLDHRALGSDGGGEAASDVGQPRTCRRTIQGGASCPLGNAGCAAHQLHFRASLHHS